MHAINEDISSTHALWTDIQFTYIHHMHVEARRYSRRRREVSRTGILGQIGSFHVVPIPFCLAVDRFARD